MKYCEHSQWLSLCTQGNETAFFESDRLHTLVDQIPNPDHQHPSLVVLIGNAAKTLALREIVPATKNRKFGRRRRHGEVHLHLDSSSAFHERPLLFAEGDFPERNARTQLDSDEKCHETIRRILPRVREGVPGLCQNAVADNLYSRLLCPFADVFCFFSADFDGFSPIVRHLASWLDGGKPSMMPKSTYPRVIIVTETQTIGVADEHEARIRFLSMLKDETTKDFSTRFSAIDVLCIFPSGSISNAARFRPLKESLMKASDHVRTSRTTSRTLFSARHFAAFFRLACDHFATTSKEPFDFVRTSRSKNPVSPDLDKHLFTFLSNIKSPHELTEFAVPIIASSFLLDSYPPDMHVFDIQDVFTTFYRDACYEVSRTALLVHEGSTDMVLPSSFLNMIKSQLEMWFDALVEGHGRSSANIHLENLRRLQRYWIRVRSDTTCFVCLSRTPQFALPCGHSLCETCVRIFGEGGERETWSFRIHSCFLCGLRSDVTVKVKPDTAGVRILSIDGGGVRGIVPLQMLKLLEDRVGLPYPVQENFDGAFGISSGCLSILALFINGWSVDDCAGSFQSLAKKAFKPRGLSQIPILSRIQKLLVSYLADSLYPADNLEMALRETFGDDSSILDCSYATTIGAKIGLPVTTIPETSSCIFTNYNGVGTRAQDCGYHVVRSKDGLSRALVWEIARSASAAPGYFRPKFIPKVGWFQDGGLWRNNPIGTALCEVQAIWPSVDEPDFVVSLGTGFQQQQPNSPRMSGPRGILRDGSIPRLCRAFLSSMSGRKMWQEFRNRRRADSKGRYFRFDIGFEGEEPGLDNTSKMQELRTQARAEFSDSRELDDLARSVVASLFYFELEPTPKYRDGKISCAGNILCRHRVGNPALEALFNQLSKSSAQFLLDEHAISGAIEDRSFLDRGGNFRKRVEFSLCDRQRKISISLKEGSHLPNNVSGSPFSVDSLVAAQGMDAHFGRADHKKRKQPDDFASPGPKRRRTTA